MSEETVQSAGISGAGAEILLQRAIRDTLLLGLIPAVVLLFVSGWRNAAMLAVGTAISAASILEWKRLLRFVRAKLEGQKTSVSALLVAVSFVLRLTIFAAAIYGSLKCFRGSVAALLCGLGLALVTLAYEALRLLRE